ncbi:Uncharacterised protein [Escherichia coli]|uniref:Uncharacterized protein n=1 Tax=Escherichia coli TaxID=562 RepID=A0A376L2L8_ECOLX|nr:Uncharacterised protein [Escherichia coli]
MSCMLEWMMFYMVGKNIRFHLLFVFKSQGGGIVFSEWMFFLISVFMLLPFLPALLELYFPRDPEAF